MKRNFLILLSACSLLFVFSGCNLQIPQKVSVKTDAEYNFQIGDFKTDFSESFNMQSLFENLNIGNARVYDYYPTGSDVNVQKFLIKIPLLEIPVDFSSYFNSSALAGNLEGLSFSREVSIPSIALNVSQSVSSDQVSTALNASFTFSGSNQFGTINFATNFTSVTYSQGSFVISCPTANDSTKVTLRSGNREASAFFSSGTATIPISNFPIYKASTTLEFSQNPGGTYLGTIASGSVLSRVEGITVDTPISIPSVNSSIDLSSYSNTFTSCTIDRGSLNTRITFPEAWSGITVTYGMTASGGLSFTMPAEEGVSKTVNLSGKTITPQTISISTTMSFRLTNATFTLADLTFAVSSQIEKFSSINLELTGLTTSFSQSQALPDSVIETVKSIGLGVCGLTGTYTNTFPTGNNISLTASSNFLGLTESTQTFEAGTNNGEISLLTSGSRTVQIGSPAPKFNSWDFSASIALPGSDSSHPNRLIIENVESGATYSLAMTLTPQIDWSQITIDTSNFSLNNSSDLGFSLGSLFQEFDNQFHTSFANEIAVDSLPVYLYCSKPEVNENTDNPFENAAFSGNVSLYTGSTSTSSNTVNLVDGSITFQNPPDLQISNNVVKTDISGYRASIDSDLSSIINNGSTENLHLAYNLSFTNGSGENEITITPSMLQSTSSASVIGVTAMIIVPLKFSTKSNPLEIDIFSLMGGSMTSGDLFGRSAASDFDQIQEYLRTIRYVSLTYDAKKMLFYSNPDISLKVDFTEPEISKTCKLSGDTLTVYGSEIDSMLSTYPLAAPSVKICIAPNTTLSISRVLGIDMSLALKIKTDGKVTLFGGQ